MSGEAIISEDLVFVLEEWGFGETDCESRKLNWYHRGRNIPNNLLENCKESSSRQVTRINPANVNATNLSKGPEKWPVSPFL